MKLNDKRVTNAWCMYDWANSVYSLTITTAVFPIYYESVTTQPDGTSMVSFLGFTLPNTVLYSYALSFSFLLTASILPLLTGVADYGGKKKTFLKLFVYLGGLACAGMYFFTGQNVSFGILMAIIASVGYSGSLVFYDAYLPEIATPDRFDRLSARGYSMGYIGSVILLILNLAMIQMPDAFGLPDNTIPARLSFLTVAIWWIGFAQITFNRLPDNPYKRQSEGKLWRKGYQELKKVYAQIKELGHMKRYVLAFFFYNAGVQAVMYLASLFGAKELKMEASMLILTVLIIQLVAIGGAFLFARVSEKRGNIYSLMTMNLIWIAVCFAAFFVQNNIQFFILAFVVGLIMGGIQALSRATFSKLIPVETKDHASFFSFYDVTFNISIVMGTLAYGTIEYFTGSMRFSALGLALLFIIGLSILRKVKVAHNQ